MVREIAHHIKKGSFSSCALLQALYIPTSSCENPRDTSRRAKIVRPCVENRECTMSSRLTLVWIDKLAMSRRFSVDKP